MQKQTILKCCSRKQEAIVLHIFQNKLIHSETKSNVEMLKQVVHTAMTCFKGSLR